MDSFATILTALSLGFVYFGEKFGVGLYLLIAFVCLGALALRLGDETTYIACGSAGVICLWRMLFVRRDGDTQTESFNDDFDDYED